MTEERTYGEVDTSPSARQLRENVESLDMEQTAAAQKDADEVRDYGVHVAPGQKAYIVELGGGRRRKKVDRKFLFRLIRAQQQKINDLLVLLNEAARQSHNLKAESQGWEERCNQLLAQIQARDSGIVTVDNPDAINAINKGVSRG